MHYNYGAVLTVIILCYGVVCVTFRFYGVQYNYCDLLRKYMNVNVGLVGGDGDNMMGTVIAEMKMKWR